MDLESIRHIYVRRVVATALGALGLDTSMRLARWLARGAFELQPEGRRVAEARLSQAFGHGATQVDANALAAAMYDHLARFWVEALFTRRLFCASTWQGRVRVEDPTGLRQLASGNRGCVLATANFGNPAVGACALGYIFRPLHVVVDTFAQPHLRAWQRELYSHRWIRAIDRRDAPRKLPDILDRGGAVMVLCDSERRGGKAHRVPFLGGVLRCYPTVARLARWHDVPIGVFTCRRLGHRGFSFALDLHTTVEPDCAASDDDAVMHRVMGALEQAILMHPEQYFWALPARRPGGRIGARLTGTKRTEPARAVARTGTGSARCRTTRRTRSVWRTPSAGDKMRGNPVTAAEPAPTA